jgi:hypothetical protein
MQDFDVEALEETQRIAGWIDISSSLRSMGRSIASRAAA